MTHHTVGARISYCARARSLAPLSAVDHTVRRFSPTGQLLLTLGKQKVAGDNTSQDAVLVDTKLANNGEAIMRQVRTVSGRAVTPLATVG